MRLSLLRFVTIALLVVTVMSAALAARSYNSISECKNDDCPQAEASSNMPWESLARQLMGSVSF